MAVFEKEVGFSVMKPGERLDGITMAEAERGLLDLLADGETNLVIDMTRLEYISSAGLRVLLLAMKKIRAAGGRLALYGLGGMAEEVFQMSGFTSIFIIKQSLAAAKRYVLGEDAE